MATREIEAKLVLSAVDRTGKAFKSVSSRLGAVNSRAKQFNRNGRSVAQTAAAVGRAATVVGLAVGAVGIASYKKFAGDERTLTRIGITAEATREQMADIRGELYDTAKATGLQFRDMVLGLDSLTASGRNLKQAMELLPSVAVTAQASGAEMVNIATTADALSTSLNIGAKDMPAAFDMLIAGAKEGKFELKDMAQYLPSLAPQMSALGYEGLAGLKKLIVSLQIIREQTGSASETATAFSDVMTKMESQTTNNAFKKFGIDLRGSLDKARDSGEDILDAFIRITKIAIDGDLSKIPQLFADKELQKGARNLIMRADSEARYIKAISNSSGSAMRDMNVVLDDHQARIDAMARSWDRASGSFGGYIAPFVGGAIDATTDFFEKGQAIQRGMEMDGIGFLEKLYLQAPSHQDTPEANRWAKIGGWKPKPIEGGKREGAREKVEGTDFQMPVNAPVPTFVSPVAGGKSETKNVPGTKYQMPVNAPVPLFRENLARYIPPHQRRVGAPDDPFAGTPSYNKSRIDGAFDDQVKLPGNALSNFDENGKFTKPFKEVQLTAELETTSADKTLDQFSDKARQPVTARLDLDTSAADVALRNFERRVTQLKGDLDNLGSGSKRDLGQSMPGAR
ncbi:MAG: phage tail tape measure protein [Rhizobiaceae bacterium]|nr:phage tail tape measure protein [Rhizobiaceae bacterium]